MSDISYGRRAASYWFVDGLPQIYFGLVLAGLAGLAIWMRLCAPGRWARMDMLIILQGCVLYYWTERGVLDFLKARITYPRTGYAQAPEEDEQRVRGQSLTPIELHLEDSPVVAENVTSFRRLTVAPVYYYFLVVLFNGVPLGRWLTPLSMVVMAGLLYVANRRSELPVRWWSAVLLGLSGTLSLLVRLPEPLQRSLPLLLVGLWFVAEGGCKLVRYLRQNPVAPVVAGVHA